jgi:hypothetical protein
VGEMGCLKWQVLHTINWNFLFKSLHALNFGEKYIGYIKTLYKDVEVCVTNNGYHVIAAISSNYHME